MRETGRPGLRLGTWEVRLDWEANIGYWTPASSRAERRAIIDIGLTPVLRLAPGERGRFFVEAGIGAHLLSDTSPYRGRELGSAFQFGDLIGIGWRLGDRNGYEVALRIEHFSNAGIKHPNQGIEFAMLRLVRWLSAGPLA
ncbi:MAG TPA: acyloxyacyl hydrolase [Burkholderiales bacterium]|nr:acyloxyacyl hydrolase [Burkholderiales bacterium]